MEDIYSAVLNCLSPGMRPGALIVDAGSGSGELSRILADHGFDVMAIDPLATEGETTAHSGGIRYVRGVAERIPLDSGSADAVVSVRALHHMNAPLALAEFQRVIRMGGRLCIADWVRGADTGIPEDYFSPAELREMLVSAGFADVSQLPFPDSDIMLFSARK